MAKLVSATYGDALFELALENDSIDNLYEEVKGVRQVFLENNELVKLLNHPKIDKDDKIQVMENVFKGRISDDLTGFLILTVKKDRYKPFSMTVNEKTFDKPIEVSIEKSNAHDISIDSDMYHLGDGSYSDNSANAGEFHSSATGPFYTKKFNLRNINLKTPVYLVIGSIIGIDTLMARTMGQNRSPNAYASPPEVYFNGNKIAEIQINGDGQKIKLPANLIHRNGQNEVTIKTGRNLMQTSYVDYDDIEFMNIMIEN